MKYGTVGAGAVVEEELPSPKLKKLFVNSFGGAGRAPRVNKNIVNLNFILIGCIANTSLKNLPRPMI